MKKLLKRILKSIFFFLPVAVIIFIAVFFYLKFVSENKVLKQIIDRLEANSRIAEVLVTDVSQDKNTEKTRTTIKFLEFDSSGKALEPKYFTFSGNIIQFQSLVVRFDSRFIRTGDNLRGKSVYLFWKAFVLEGSNTQEFEITKVYEVPQGYKIEGGESVFEEELWKTFWEYVLDHNKAAKMGIKNAQIEAPGTQFVPGMLYIIRIEHNGGMRIDPVPIPQILKGEKIPE